MPAFGGSNPPAPAIFFGPEIRSFIAVSKIFPRTLGTGEPLLAAKTRFSEIFGLKIRYLRTTCPGQKLQEILLRIRGEHLHFIR